MENILYTKPHKKLSQLLLSNQQSQDLVATKNNYLLLLMYLRAGCRSSISSAEEYRVAMFMGSTLLPWQHVEQSKYLFNDIPT